MVILILALLAASRIYKIQKDKTEALKEEIAIQEQRIELALELAGLDKRKYLRTPGLILRKRQLGIRSPFTNSRLKPG